MSTVTEIERNGLPGQGNEDIARGIINKARSSCVQVVMWSGFDRVSRDHNQRYPNVGEGQYQGTDYSLSRLLSRTVEQIWLVDRWCRDQQITIHHFLAMPMELGEQSKVTATDHVMLSRLPEFPISFAEHCVDHAAVHPHPQDGHPMPSQHLDYYNRVMAPILGTQQVRRTPQQLSDMDQRYAKTAKQWPTYRLRVFGDV